MNQQIETAKERFGQLLEEQMARVERMKQQKDFVDYQAKEQIVIGIAGGDGIGPAITAQAKRIMEFLLKDAVQSGKVVFKMINDLTIEKRVEAMKAIPDNVVAELKQCDVILKGPTTTPRAGDPWQIGRAHV